MSGHFNTISTPWFSHADGTFVPFSACRGEVLDRLDALPDSTWDQIADAVGSRDMSEFAWDDPHYEFAAPDMGDAKVYQIGKSMLRKKIIALLEVVDRKHNPMVDFVFNGARWMAESAYSSIHGEDTVHDTYLALVGLCDSGVADAPIGGGEFVDIPHLTAALTVTGGIAAQLRNAVAVVGVDDPARALEAVRRELDAVERSAPQYAKAWVEAHERALEQARNDTRKQLH